MSQDPPLSFRPSEEDRKIIELLKERLGLGFSQLVKLGLRRLRDQEMKIPKK